MNFVLFYSTLDQESQLIKKKMTTDIPGIKLKLICVDSMMVRNILESSSNIKIDQIPSILMVDTTSNTVSTFEGFDKCHHKINSMIPSPAPPVAQITSLQSLFLDEQETIDKVTSKTGSIDPSNFNQPIKITSTKF